MRRAWLNIERELWPSRSQLDDVGGGQLDLSRNHIAVEKRAVSAVEVNELEAVGILDPDCSVTATDIVVSK